MYQYEQRRMDVLVRTENDGCISTNREGWIYKYEQSMIGESVRTERAGYISTNERNGGCISSFSVRTDSPIILCSY